MLIQIISIILRNAVAAAGPQTANEIARQIDSDPLSHPVVAKMTPDELADLPFHAMYAADPDRSKRRDAPARSVSAPVQETRAMTGCPECA